MYIYSKGTSYWNCSGAGNIRKKRLVELLKVCKDSNDLKKSLLVVMNFLDFPGDYHKAVANQ